MTASIAARAMHLLKGKDMAPYSRLYASLAILSVGFGGLGGRVLANSPPAVPQPATLVTYVCDHDRTIQAAFIEGSHTSYAVLYDAGRLHLLTHSPSGSGARYTDPQGLLELWTKGMSADLRILGDEEVELYRDCNQVPTAYGQIR
ncbi:MliC family protein [Paracoccus aurantiacus]